MKVTRSLPILASLLFLAGPVQAQWSTDFLSLQRYQLAATTVGTKAVFAGGYPSAGTVSAVVDIYDSATGSWTTAYLSIARGWLTAASVGDKAVFAGGLVNGSSSYQVDIYNNSTGTWWPAQLSQPRYGLAAGSLGDKLYIAGGWNTLTGFPSAVIDIYDDSTGTWSVASLSMARTDLAVTTVGTKILFAGGWNGMAHTKRVDIYDSSTSTWSTAALYEARGRLSAVTVGTKAIFAGGGSATIGDSSRVDIYDSSTNWWTTATLSAPREFMGATTVGSQAIFAGGWNGVAGAVSEVIDIYDDRSGIWSSASTLPSPSWGLAATTAGGKAFFAGGSSATTVHMTVEVYESPSNYTLCFGDPGYGTPCPCGNDNDGSVPLSGCANGFFASGAQIAIHGVASLSSDSLILSTSRTEPQNSGLYFQADNIFSMGNAWGDGLQCAGGQLRRLGVVTSSYTGYSNTWGLPQPISVMAGNIQAGDTKFYQCWYRNPAGSPCGHDFNASNAVGITWLP